MCVIDVTQKLEYKEINLHIGRLCQNTRLFFYLHWNERKMR